MTTHMRILSSLALTAAMLATVSSDAVAGIAGIGGIRSLPLPRTSHVVVIRRTTTTVRKRPSAVSQAKLKNFQVGDKLKNKQVVDKVKTKQEDRLKDRQEDKLKHAKVSPQALPCTTPLLASAASPCPPASRPP